MTIQENGHRTRAFGPIFGHRMGVEVAPGLLIAMTVGRRAVAMATMRRLRTTTPAASLPIAELIGRRGADLSHVHLVSCDSDHQHRTLIVPPMTDLERSEVVRRETGRDESGDRNPIWRRVGQVETDGVRKDELLIVTASSARVQQALDPILAGGVVPRLIVTGPLALIAAARALVPSPLDRPTVLVHWGVSSLTMVILSEGVLRFARVIVPPSSNLDPLGWIPVEIDRSLRHYAVLSKGQRVEQIVVSVAEGEPARRLFTDDALAQRLRLPVTNLNALLAPELPLRWDIDSELTDVEMAEGVFTLAYGAALLKPTDVPNLLPPALTLRHRSRRVMAGAAAAGALVAVALGSKSIAMADQTKVLQERLARTRTAQQTDQTRIELAGRVETERQAVRDLARLLTTDPLKRLPADAALKEIARLAPVAVRLDQLTVSPDAAGQAFRLAGRVEESDFAAAQKELNRFYYGLRGSQLFFGVQLQPTAAAAPSAPLAADAKDAVETSKPDDARVLPFVITLKPKELQ